MGVAMHGPTLSTGARPAPRVFEEEDGIEAIPFENDGDRAVRRASAHGSRPRTGT